MELRHLVALEAVATGRSFSGAAASLGYTQSAVSGQILALERVVGMRLIERVRGGKPVRLTAEGEILLRHARAINGRLDAARAEIAALRHAGAAVLRVGVHEAVNRMLVPETLRRLAGEHPAADVELRQIYDVSSLMDELERCTVDVVLTALPVRAGPFDAVAIYRDEHVLVVRASDPLAARREVTLEELGGLGIIAIDDCRAQAAIESALDAAGWPLNVIRRLEDTASILAFVSSGLGVGFVPALAVELPDGLVALPLPEAVPARVVVAVRNRELEASPWATRFVELATIVAQELVAPATPVGAGIAAPRAD